VLDVIEEVGFDLSDGTPRGVTLGEFRSCDYVATMDCSTLDVRGVSDDADIRALL